MMVASGCRGGPGTNDPGRFTCSNASLAQIVIAAYQLKAYQLTPPGWMTSTRLDIAAKIPEGTTRGQLILMEQNLLAERFKLAVHFEQKEMQTFELAVGKHGPKLTESEETPPPSPGATPPAPPSGPPKLDGRGLPMLAPGSVTMTAYMNGGTTMRMGGASLEALVDMLTNRLRRPVINATGLKRRYDITLNFVQDSMSAGRGSAAVSSDGGGALAIPEIAPGPTIFEAVQQQLGLKLESKKGMVDVLVIDHAEKTPIEN